MCGDTKLDRIRNERIRESPKVGEIAMKIQERRWNWCGQWAIPAETTILPSKHDIGTWHILFLQNLYFFT